MKLAVAVESASTSAAAMNVGIEIKTRKSRLAARLRVWLVRLRKKEKR